MNHRLVSPARKWPRTTEKHHNLSFRIYINISNSGGECVDEDWMCHLHQFTSFAVEYESPSSTRLNDFQHSLKQSAQAFKYYLNLREEPEMPWKTLLFAFNSRHLSDSKRARAKSPAQSARICRIRKRFKVRLQWFTCTDHRSRTFSKPLPRWGLKQPCCVHGPLDRSGGPWMGLTCTGKTEVENVYPKAVQALVDSLQKRWITIQV